MSATAASTATNDAAGRRSSGLEASEPSPIDDTNAASTIDT